MATQFGSSRASVASGSEPWPSTASWKARRSKSAPSRAAIWSAQPLDLALTELVGQRLTRPADVAIGLDRGIGRGESGAEERVDRALARPAQAMEPAVDDEAGGPPGLPVEHPEPLGLAAVQPHLVGQPLRVEAPALDVGAADHPRPEPAEDVEVLVLHLERDLEVMPGDGLVIGRRGELGVRPRGQVVRVGVVDPGARAVGRRRDVVGERAVALLERLDGADVAARAGQPAEVARRQRHRPVDVLAGAVEQLVGRRRDVRRIRRQALPGRPPCRRRSRVPGRSPGAPPRSIRAPRARSGGPRPGRRRASSRRGSGCGTGRPRRAPTRAPGLRDSRPGSRREARRGTPGRPARRRRGPAGRSAGDRPPRRPGRSWR